MARVLVPFSLRQNLASLCPGQPCPWRRHALRRRRHAVPVASHGLSYRTCDVSTAFVGRFSVLGIIRQTICGTGRPHKAAPTKGDGLYLAQRPSGSRLHPLSRVLVAAGRQ